MMNAIKRFLATRFRSDPGSLATIRRELEKSHASNPPTELPAEPDPDLADYYPIRCVRCGTLGHSHGGRDGERFVTLSKRLEGVTGKDLFKYTEEGILCPSCSHEALVSVADDYRKNAEALPPANVLRMAVLDNAVRASSNSLLTWAIINLALWYFTWSETTPGMAGSGLLAYGSVVIAAFMLLSAVAGYVSRHGVVGWLDGLLLFAIGTWNILTLFVHGNALWVCLGLIQLSWGARQIYRFRFLCVEKVRLDRESIRVALDQYDTCASRPTSFNQGRLRFAVSPKFQTPLLSEQPRRWTMWLLPDRAVCVEDDFRDIFELERRSIAGHSYTSSSVELQDTNGRKRLISLDLTALGPINEWAKVGVQQG